MTFMVAKEDFFKSSWMSHKMDGLVEGASELKGHGKHRLCAEIWVPLDRVDGKPPTHYGQISWGYNHKKSSSYAKRYARNELVIGTCAEMEAMIRVIITGGHDLLKGSTILIARAKKDKRGGEWIRGMSRPCDGCMKMMRDFKVGTIIFTNDHESCEVYGMEQLEYTS